MRREGENKKDFARRKDVPVSKRTDKRSLSRILKEAKKRGGILTERDDKPHGGVGIYQC